MNIPNHIHTWELPLPQWNVPQWNHYIHVPQYGSKLYNLCKFGLPISVPILMLGPSFAACRVGIEHSTPDIWALDLRPVVQLLLHYSEVSFPMYCSVGLLDDNSGYMWSWIPFIYCILFWVDVTYFCHWAWSCFLNRVLASLSPGPCPLVMQTSQPQFVHIDALMLVGSNQGVMMAWEYVGAGEEVRVDFMTLLKESVYGAPPLLG